MNPPPIPSSFYHLLTRYSRTKAITSASLNAISEIVASYVAGEKDPKTNSYISKRVPLMALYGLFVSAPLSHFLVLALQKAFVGKTSPLWKLLQIVVSNLVVTPIQNSVFLAFMSIFAGARTPEQVYASWKAAIMVVQRSSWITSPIVLAIAQNFVPEYGWVPFFSVFAFFLVTYNNIQVKTKRQAALKKAKKEAEDAAAAADENEKTK